MAKVYRLSSAIGKQRIPTFKPTQQTFGQAHYSWSIKAKLYFEGLRKIREIEAIQAPDIYQDEIAFHFAGLAKEVIHLADKPLETLRPMFGHTNVSIIVWEFAEFTDSPANGDPRSNQLLMLRRMDDVWCGSSFTQRNLAGLGIRARFLPPPVAEFVTSDKASIDAIPCVSLNSIEIDEQSETLADVLGERANRPIFLAVLAPYDLRKNLPALIKGFVASDASKNATLLIKLVLDNVVTTVANINAILFEHYKLRVENPNVVFCGEYLSESQMNSLYNLASFFVCASSAEGLNLPLIEAMARAIPAISPKHTAMEDYVSEERAIVVPAERRPTVGPMHSMWESLATTHYPPTTHAMQKAFDEASALSAPSRVRLGQRGAEFVKHVYGMPEFEKRVAEFEKDVA